MTPKAFISYSWTSPEHQTKIRELAERLINDGIEVVLDIYDLKEGHDKYAFMERMVTDEKMSHVLVFSDKRYAEKSDARQAGVGSESQIISAEVYEKVQQSKFIPIVCEFEGDGTPCLPTFLKSRIWIDFSSPEAVNQNWEKLVRLLYGKPSYEKPELGKPPAFIADAGTLPSTPALAKLAHLREALLHGKKGIKVYRKDFIEVCMKYVDDLRVRKRPDVEILGKKIIEDCGKLKHARDHIVEWVLLEVDLTPAEEFSESLLGLLERLLSAKLRPEELDAWNDAWFEAHKVFVYETFLYIIAALLKSEAYKSLYSVFKSHYLFQIRGESKFDTFGAFCGYSNALQGALGPQRYHSPAAELIRRQSDRADIPFESLMEAELLVLLMAFISENIQWYPQTLLYARYGTEYPFFIRATQHKGFLKMSEITGITQANTLREAVTRGQERLKIEQWQYFHLGNPFWNAMNLDKMDTLQ